MKPGNRVEEKTLPIRKGEMRADAQKGNRMDSKPGSLEYVIKRGEIVDERWQ